MMQRPENIVQLPAGKPATTWLKPVPPPVPLISKEELQKQFTKSNADYDWTLFKQHVTVQTDSLVIHETIKDSSKKISEIKITPLESQYDAFHTFTFLFLLFIFSFFAWLRINFSKYITQIVGAAFDRQLTERLLRDRSALFDKVERQLNIIFLFSGTFFTVYSLKYFGVSIIQNEFLLLGSVFIGLSLLLFLHATVARFMGHLIQKHSEFHEYIHLSFIFYKLLGIIYLPIMIFVIYLPENLQIYPIVIGWGLTLMLILYKLFKVFRLLVQKGILIFYTFLYLCSVEIIPLLIIGKYAFMIK